jgi:hypothetical protein
LYNIVRHKSDTIAIVIATLPSNVTYRRDLVGSGLIVWNALLHCLALVQLIPGTNEFRWNLHANENLSVDFMCKALILLELPVDSNKMIWKMKDTIKDFFFEWYLC